MPRQKRLWHGRASREDTHRTTPKRSRVHANAKSQRDDGHRAGQQSGGFGLSHPHYPIIGSAFHLSRHRFGRRLVGTHQHRRTDTLLYSALFASGQTQEKV